MLRVSLPRIVVTTAVTLAVAGSISCGFLDQPFAPCDQTAKNDQAKFMDGSWLLQTIDGKPLPFTLPAGAGKLLNGTIFFNTFYLDEGKCEGPKKSRGEIIALYQLATAGGAPGKNQTQIGSFEFDHASGAVTLRALGKSATATRSTNSNLDLVAPIPIAGGFLEVTYRLKFLRPFF